MAPNYALERTRISVFGVPVMSVGMHASSCAPLNAALGTRISGALSSYVEEVQMALDAAVAGLLGAAIGGGVAILKSFIDGRSQRNLEQAKAQWSREGTVATELRTHVATVARELLSAQHSMEWLCWQTQRGSKQLDEKAVTDYHGEIHATFPKLLGALAAVSSLNARAYKELSVLADKVFAIEGKIAAALVDFKTSPHAATTGVAEQHVSATSLYRELPISLARVMKDLQ
jgi:hypothetical protein